MRPSTHALAMASARHPWRTIGAWVVAVVVAAVAIVSLLGGSLTTEGNPTNDPESQRADDALSRADDADRLHHVSPWVVHRSASSHGQPFHRGVGHAVRAASTSSR